MGRAAKRPAPSVFSQHKNQINRSPRFWAATPLADMKLWASLFKSALILVALNCSLKEERVWLGLFATGAYGVPTATGFDTSTVVTGLFYGGGFGQLIAQAIGSGAV